MSEAGALGSEPTQPTRPADHRSKWMRAWLGGVALGVCNGGLREKVIARRFEEKRANQLSVLTGIAALAGYFSALQRRWPLASNREALRVGAAWAVLTTAFEFGFGRLVAGQSWNELLAAYDLRKGNLWPLMLGWIALGPAAARALRGGRRSRAVPP